MEVHPPNNNGAAHIYTHLYTYTYEVSLRTDHPPAATDHFSSIKYVDRARPLHRRGSAAKARKAAEAIARKTDERCN